MTPCAISVKESFLISAEGKEEAKLDGHSIPERAHERIPSHEGSVHKSIGFSLVTGFIVMLIIDQATRSAALKGNLQASFKFKTLF